MAFRNRLPAARPAHLRPLLTAMAIASGSMTAQALTLGRLQVLSGVGEPLRAEVEIAAATAAESQSLQAQIAPPRSFMQAGMEYNPALEGLSASIENRPGGRFFIVLQGRKPVQENFIDLILETQWSSGRLVRNYALLLNTVADKPRQEPAAEAAASALPPPAWPSPQKLPPLPSSEEKPPRIEHNAQNVPVYRFEPVDTPGEASSASRSQEAPATQPPLPPALTTRASAAFSQDGTITVEAGQTASQLALAHMPSKVSLEQMLLAMQRNNPEAFIEDNVNLVRAGAVLRMPTAEQAQQTSAEEARQIVIAQHRDFAAYAQRIAQSPQATVTSSAREASGKVSTEAQATASAAATQDSLTLSKASVGKDSTEAKVATEREAQEAADQMAALKKNVEALNSLASAASAASEPGAPMPGDRAAAGKENQTGQAVWIWGAILTALLGLFLWRRHRASPTSDTFAPSYDDEPMTAAAPSHAADAVAIPPQMAGIDLNLPAQSEASVSIADSPAAANQDTDAAKLELARVLLSKGDTAIARSLAQSVATHGTGELQAQAQQLLSQFP